MKTIVMIVVCMLVMSAACDIERPNWGETALNQKLICRANMRTIASEELIYFAQHGRRYAESMADLGLADMKCPAHGSYVITVENNSTFFTVACPGDHGSIANGITSWINVDE
ncbi:MAG: hypothetical protein WC455_09380 [Dehalococcoidia bacterium]|jgi:hypothetical protein